MAGTRDWGGELKSRKALRQMCFVSLLGPLQYDGWSCAAHVPLAQAGSEGSSGLRGGTFPSSAVPLVSLK